MSQPFNPDKFKVFYQPNSDPDTDWMQLAKKFSTPADKIVGKKQRYIPALPLSFLLAIAPAKDAVVILLIMLSEMRMRKITEFPIGPSIWKKAGIGSKRIRSRLLRHIGILPDCLCKLIPRKGRAHLLVAGPDWPKPLITRRKPP